VFAVKQSQTVTRGVSVHALQGSSLSNQFWDGAQVDDTVESPTVPPLQNRGHGTSHAKQEEQKHHRRRRRAVIARGNDDNITSKSTTRREEVNLNTDNGFRTHLAAGGVQHGVQSLAALRDLLHLQPVSTEYRSTRWRTEVVEKNKGLQAGSHLHNTPAPVIKSSAQLAGTI
jgi:hypothetical protein